MTEENTKTFSELSKEEKGELLLAHHERKVIEWLDYNDQWNIIKSPCWDDDTCYRIKPETKTETVTLYGDHPQTQGFADYRYSYDTHKLTFNVIDGIIDCGSVKLEEL